MTFLYLYFCYSLCPFDNLVSFVKPNILGTFKDFLNQFVQPITQGRYADSTPNEIHGIDQSHILKMNTEKSQQDKNTLTKSESLKVLLDLLTEAAIPANLGANEIQGKVFELAKLLCKSMERGDLSVCGEFFLKSI